MKKYFLITLLIAACIFRSHASEEPTFLQQVNNLWMDKNYDQILQVAQTEAAKQPPPPEAYAVIFCYYLFIEANHEHAVESLDSLLAMLEDANHEDFQAVTNFKNEFMQIPSDHMQPPSPEELNSLHEMFPDNFPVRFLLLLLSKPE